MYSFRVSDGLGRLSLLLCVGIVPIAAEQVFGPNLILNGDAEAGSGSLNDVQVASVPNWTNAGANVIVYASRYGLDENSILPSNIGKNYFSSGTTNSNLTQTVNLATAAAGIDAGTAVYTVSGYFGGYGNRDDYASLTVTYLGINNDSLDTVTIGSVKSADRYGTGLYFRRQIGLVPTGTRSATVTLSFTLATAGSNNKAYADNLSLILNTPVSAATFLGRNLIVNGDGEAGLPIPLNASLALDVPGWVRTSNFTAESYARSPEVDLGDPGPPDHGNMFFLGGPANESSSAYQDIDISPLASQVDAGAVKFAFGAWLGGFISQEDYTVASARFMNWTGDILGSSQLGPVTSTDRRGITSFLQRSANGTIPAGTRKIQVRMDMLGFNGTFNSGSADSLALILNGAGGGAPTISSGGVNTAAAYGGFAQIAPGTWIEIYGQNLAAVAREWAGSDFAGSSAPSVLDGVQVSVGGQNAYVRYISAGQINVQVPSGVPAGQQPLVVTNSMGSSAAYPITVNSTQPGFLAPALLNVSGKQYVAGFFADGSTFTLPARSIPGITSRAARPGDIVVLYGVGFGSTSPNIVAGQVVKQANSLANSLQISIGGAVATTVYSGLSPDYVGLYQINVVIPSVAAGDALPLAATLGGVPVAQTLYIAVGK